MLAIIALTAIWKLRFAKKLPFFWEGERGEERAVTYEDLYIQVCKFSNVLKNLGIKKGDKVAIYLPMVPEAVIAMLSCARIGAVHTVIFAGFSADSLRDRIQDSEAKLLITADGGFRKGKIVGLKETADLALEGTSSLKTSWCCGTPINLLPCKLPEIIGMMS